MNKKLLKLKVESVALLKTPDFVNDINTFGSFNWITEWRKTFKLPVSSHELYTIYSNNTLVAIAPFYAYRPRTFSQLKTLYPLGQGEAEKSEIASEYNDIYFLSGYEEEVIHLLAKKLKTLNFDQLLWRSTLQNSHITHLLKTAFNYKAPVIHARYFIETSAWSLNRLSKNTLSRYNRTINQLNKLSATFKLIEKEGYKYFSNLLPQNQKALKRRPIIG